MSVSSARLSVREVEGTRPGFGPSVSPLSPILGLSQLLKRKLEHRRWWQLSWSPCCLLEDGGSCRRVSSPPARAIGPPEACGAFFPPWETCPLPVDSWATRVTFTVSHPVGMSRPRSLQQLGCYICMARHTAGDIILHRWLRPLSLFLCPGTQVPPCASPSDTPEPSKSQHPDPLAVPSRCPLLAPGTACTRCHRHMATPAATHGTCNTLRGVE